MKGDYPIFVWQIVQMQGFKLIRSCSQCFRRNFVASYVIEVQLPEIAHHAGSLRGGLFLTKRAPKMGASDYRERPTSFPSYPLSGLLLSTWSPSAAAAAGPSAALASVALGRDTAGSVCLNCHGSLVHNPEYPANYRVLVLSSIRIVNYYSSPVAIGLP